MNIIGNKSEIIELNFLSRSYPDSLDENDKKWIDTEIVIKLNGYNAKQYISLYKDDIDLFFNSIQDVIQLKSNVIEFNNMEEIFHLRGEIIGENVNWNCLSNYPAGSTTKLSFSFSTNKNDLIYLKNSLQEEIFSI